MVLRMPVPTANAVQVGVRRENKLERRRMKRADPIGP